MSLETMLVDWNKATSNLPWGVARAFHDAFTLAADGKYNLVYGADFRDNGACLVNSVGSMLRATGGKTGHGLPMSHFAEIVSLFDRINSELFSRMVNTQNGYVSPLAADIFLHHFCELKTYAEAKREWELAHKHETPFIEPTDEQMRQSMETLFTSETPLEFSLDNFTDITREHENH